MEMAMEPQYWPQHKMFFLATLALFPENLKGITVTLLFYRPYFAHDDVTVIELTLQEYAKDGYIKYEKSGAGAGEFKITEIDTQKAADDLIDYIEKWLSDKLVLLAAKKPEDAERQQELLLAALARAYRRNPKGQLRVTLEDVYGHPSNDIFGTPFWELVLSLQLSEQPGAMITRIGYDRSMDGLYADDAQPFVDIKITNQGLLRSIELMAKSSEPISDEEPQELNYNGLSAHRDDSFSYKAVDIPFTPQEAAVMRVFMARPEEWRYESDFTDPLANVFSDPVPSDIHKALSQLISRTRIKLNAAVGHDQSCIPNKRDVGWKLIIQLTE